MTPLKFNMLPNARFYSERTANGRIVAYGRQVASPHVPASIWSRIWAWLLAPVAS